MADVELDPLALANIRLAIGVFLDAKLGPLIVADAKRYAPKRTSAMADAIFHTVAGEMLWIISPASYSAWVEEGHLVYHPSTGAIGPEFVPAEPFLRPALYKYRSPEDPEGTPPLIPPGVAHPGITYPNLRSWEEAHADLGSLASWEARHPWQNNPSWYRNWLWAFIRPLN
jgi:hypothetical protein